MTKFDIDEVVAYFNDHTLKETSKFFGVSCGTMKAFLRNNNINTRKCETGSELLERVSVDEVRRYYLDCNHTQAETAKHFNVSSSQLSVYIRKFNLKKADNDITPQRKSPTKGTDLDSRVTPDEVIDYYITKNHSKDDTIEYFKTTYRIFSKYLSTYNIVKPMVLASKLCKQTKLEKYNDENYNNQPKIIKTCLEKYNSTSPLGCRDIGEQTYNTTISKYGGTGFQLFSADKRTDIAIKAAKRCWYLYGNDEDFRNNYKKAQYDTKKANKTFNVSKPEDEMFEELKRQYGEDDVVHIYNTDCRYPYNCDFYIKSQDLFIELNLHPSHGGHRFDPTNEEDVKLKEDLENKDDRGSKMILDVGTVRDVAKYECAKKNNLNYLTIY